MKKSCIFVLFFSFSFFQLAAQDVQIDGRLQPYLQQFFSYCKAYNIEYHEKLFNLKNIDIVDTLHISPSATTLGMLTRDENKKVENIVVSYVALLDQEILKVVAFHEFAHYFLGYNTHICDDCGKIMAVVNSSYFDIVNDWDNQIKILFTESPIYKLQNGVVYTETKPVEEEEKTYYKF